MGFFNFKGVQATINEFKYCLKENTLAVLLTKYDFLSRVKMLARDKQAKNCIW